jgi:hypothetical protein
LDKLKLIQSLHAKTEVNDEIQNAILELKGKNIDKHSNSIKPIKSKSKSVETTVIKKSPTAFESVEVNDYVGYLKLKKSQIIDKLSQICRSRGGDFSNSE